MKKIEGFMIVLIAVFALSGCGDSAYEDGYEDGFYDGARIPESGMTTLFLIDINGDTAADIHYVCEDSSGYITADVHTAPNGEFTFYPGESCAFDLIGDGTPMDPLFIEDDIGRGKNNIPYFCDAGDNGLTDYDPDSNRDGYFDYMYNDRCVFYF